ncbi:metallophosphoesterase family protein [Ureaplasma ceti]|uniref:Phosphoesterase n=1 Tax=Ureaplasma ceti TaxID=3119530 RepID=A0ABP9U6K5_9BACT
MNELNKIELTFNNLKKVLVVSDIHGYGYLLDEVIELEQPDLVLLAGDHCLKPEFLDERHIVYVAGNNDDWGPERLVINLNGMRVGLIHGHKQFSFTHWETKLENEFAEDNVDLIIYGHSHKESFDNYKKPYILNPGSLALPRNKNLSRTYVLIDFINNKTEVLFKTYR